MRRLGFIALVVVQVLLVLLVPARAWWIREHGQTIYLRTQPVDPYSILGGYYVTLSYEISGTWLMRPDQPQSAFATQAGKLGDQGDYTLYVVMRRESDGTSSFARLSKERPTGLVEGEVALRGRMRGYLVYYGIERFYIPEAERHRIEALTRDGHRPVVEIRVTSGGDAIPVALHIAGRRFSY